MLGLDRLKLGKKFTVLATALFIFNSCASQDVTTEELPDLPTSEASLLDESEQSTPVGDDSAIFADLNPMDASSGSESGSNSSSKASADATASYGDPFYNPIGGESLARVAYTLYGDKALAKALRAQNPSLAGVKKLEMGQTVYFEFDKLKPTPTYLTKDLIDRYSDELAEKLGSNGDLGKDQVVLEKGETLQSLSQRLYGTTRYWTEIYLLNKGNLKSYDKVAAGVSLVVFQRSPAGAPTSPNDNVMARVEQRAPEVKAPIASPSPITPVAPVAEERAIPPPAVETPADPIPETPPAAVSAPAPEPYVPQPLATQGGSSDSNNIATAAGNSNTRRIIYVALILLVGGLAFYFTRPKKKKFDMLDATTASSGRQKLGSEQKKDIV